MLHRSMPVPKRFIALAVILLGLFWNSSTLYQIIAETPILAEQSDIIPSLQYYVQRLIAGDKVYAPMPFHGYEVLPTYFPMMWLPYIIPEVMGIDYRWLPLLAFYAIYAHIVFYTTDEKQSIFYVIIKSLLPALAIYFIAKHDVSVFKYSVELLPISYYLLLIYGLYKKNPWLIGAALAFCTLGRYAYSLWIIPFIVIIWYAKGFSYLLKIGGTGIAALLILYFIPFFMHDPDILFDGLAYYKTTVESQWVTQSWQAEGAIPYHLDRGLSLSHWYYTHIEGSHLDKLSIATRDQSIAIFLTALLLTSIYFLRSRFHKTLAWNHYLIYSLFLYLCVFYSFITVPFSYLFLLPLMVGFVIYSLYDSLLDD